MTIKLWWIKITDDKKSNKLNLCSDQEALQIDIALDAKRHFCRLSDQEKEEARRLREYFSGTAAADSCPGEREEL